MGEVSDNVTISASTSGITVMGANATGGLIGFALALETAIDTTFATGDVTGEQFVGGLVGLLRDSSVVDSGAGGDVTGVSDVGGLVGQLEISTIDSSAALGAVMADSIVGGLVGDIQDSAITNTFATCLLYTSPSPRDRTRSRMPSSA